MNLKLVLAVSATLMASPAFANEIDLSGEVNASLATYTNGSVYGTGGPITIGGINFNLDAYPSPAGVGVIQTSASSTTPFAISVNQFGVTTVYTIANSAFGESPDTAGQLVFNGSGGLTYTYTYTEGTNIRDHATTSFNITAPDVFATDNVGEGDRFDVQKIILPTAFDTATLESIDFSYVGNTVPGDGEAFLAAVTTSTAAVSAVPEPLTLSLFGAGLAGAVAMRRRRKEKA